MQLNEKNITRILLCAAVMVIAISTYTCNKFKSDSQGKGDYISSLDDTITFLKSGVAQKPAVQVTKAAFEDIVNQNAILMAALKEAELKAKNVTSITTASSTISLPDPIIITLSGDSLPCPDFKPVPFRKDSIGAYSIAGVIMKTGIRLDTINFPDTLFIITGHKRHFFKKDEFVVTASHSNKYFKINGLHNLTVKDERKWWQGRAVPIIGAFIGGVYISRKIIK